MREKISSHDLRQISILRIDDIKVLQLITEYKKEPCLWDSSLDDYPNKTKRARAADKIARILNIKDFGGKHVLIKFKNLRNSYSQEVKKIKASLDKVGANSPKMYRPKVKWFPLMDSFIRPHLQTPQLIANEPSMKEVTNVKIECYEIVEQEDWGIQAQIEAEPAVNYTQSEDQSENEKVSSNSRAKRRRRSHSSGPSDNFSQNQISLTNDVAPIASAAPVAAARTEDTYDNFGKDIASPPIASAAPVAAARTEDTYDNFGKDIASPPIASAAPVAAARTEDTYDNFGKDIASPPIASAAPVAAARTEDTYDNFGKYIASPPIASAAPVAAARTEDTYDNFGKYIASLLRSLPASKALRLQPKIVDMIVSVSVGEEENNILIEINKLSESQTE